MCSGDGLGRKRKSQELRGHSKRKDGETPRGDAERKRRRAPEEAAMADWAARLSRRSLLQEGPLTSQRFRPAAKQRRLSDQGPEPARDLWRPEPARRSGGWWRHQPPFSFLRVMLIHAIAADHRSNRSAGPRRPHDGAMRWHTAGVSRHTRQSRTYQADRVSRVWLARDYSAGIRPTCSGSRSRRCRSIWSA